MTHYLGQPDMAAISLFISGVDGGWLNREVVEGGCDKHVMYLLKAYGSHKIMILSQDYLTPGILDNRQHALNCNCVRLS